MHSAGKKAYRVLVGPLGAVVRPAIKLRVPINVENFFINWGFVSISRRALL